MFFENTDRQEQHIIKVHHILQFQQFLVALINFRQHLIGGTVLCRIIQCIFRCPHAVFAVPDKVHRLRCGDLILRIAQFCCRLTGNTGLVGGICNAVIGIIVPGITDIPAQNPGTERVEGTERDCCCSFRRYDLPDAFPHFFCRLVGKSHAENRCRIDPLFDHVCNSRRDHTGLAGTGTCKHKHRSLRGPDSLQLFRVQAVKNGFCHQASCAARSYAVPFQTAAAAVTGCSNSAKRPPRITYSQLSCAVRASKPSSKFSSQGRFIS